MEQYANHKHFEGLAGPVRSAGPHSMRQEAFALFMEFNMVAGPGQPDPSEGKVP